MKMYVSIFQSLLLPGGVKTEGNAKCLETPITCEVKFYRGHRTLLYEV